VTPEPAGRAVRILVVEDEPVNRALLRAVFARDPGPLRHAEIVEAGTLAEARTALAAGAPDIVILDLRLPDGGGLELAHELRRDGDARADGDGPRIVVMSASVGASDRDAARLAGTDAFLGKPFLPRDLVVLLESLLSTATREADGAAGA
jgi:CheY-like chemotaxis protein